MKTGLGARTLRTPRFLLIFEDPFLIFLAKSCMPASASPAALYLQLTRAHRKETMELLRQVRCPPPAPSSLSTPTKPKEVRGMLNEHTRVAAVYAACQSAAAASCAAAVAATGGFAAPGFAPCYAAAQSACAVQAGIIAGVAVGVAGGSFSAALPALMGAAGLAAVAGRTATA